MNEEQELAMSPKQFVETQMRVIEMGKIADSLDIDAFLKCIANAEAMAPMVDPAMLSKAAATMTAIKRIALVAKEMKAAYGETYKDVFNATIVGRQ